MQEAIKQKKTAALLEEKTADIFQTQVGQLPANKHCDITISYVTQVPLCVNVMFVCTRTG